MMLTVSIGLDSATVKVGLTSWLTSVNMPAIHALKVTTNLGVESSTYILFGQRKSGHKTVVLPITFLNNKLE